MERLAACFDDLARLGEAERAEAIELLELYAAQGRRRRTRS